MWELEKWGASFQGRNFVKTLSSLSSPCQFSGRPELLQDRLAATWGGTLPFFLVDTCSLEALTGDSHPLCCNRPGSNINRAWCRIQPCYITELWSHTFQMLCIDTLPTSCTTCFFSHIQLFWGKVKDKLWGEPSALNLLGKCLFWAHSVLCLFAFLESLWTNFSFALCKLSLSLPSSFPPSIPLFSFPLWRSSFRPLESRFCC